MLPASLRAQMMAAALAAGTFVLPASAQDLGAHLSVAPDDGTRWNSMLPSLGTPVMAPDTGETWDAMQPSLGSLPTPRRESPTFDMFAQSPLDVGTASGLDADSVTVASLTADAIWAAADITRNHTLPGGITALHALGASLFHFEQSSAARGEALMRMAEIKLRVAGDSNGAALIAAGGAIIASESPTAGTSYMRGMAQDLRRAGAVSAAQYLENAAVLADDELSNARTGVLDAAALALRFGVAPNSEAAAVVGYDPETVTPETMRDMVAELLNDLAAVTGDTSYADLSALLLRGANEDGIRHIRARIIEAQGEAEEARRARFTSPENSTDRPILGGN